MCLCVREKERESVFGCVWVRERVCVYGCERERERETLYVCDRERECVCVCMSEKENESGESFSFPGKDTTTGTRTHGLTISQGFHVNLFDLSFGIFLVD